MLAEVSTADWQVDCPKRTDEVSGQSLANNCNATEEIIVRTESSNWI